MAAHALVDDPILGGFSRGNGAGSGTGTASADPVAAAFAGGQVAPGQGAAIDPSTGQPRTPIAGPIAGGANTPGFNPGIGVSSAPAGAPGAAGGTAAGTTTTTDGTTASPGTVAATQATDQATTAAQAANPATAAVGSPSQIASTAPLPYQAFGNIPTVNPTEVDTTALPGALQAFEGDNAAALAPQFQAENLSLDDNLGSRGIVDSGAAQYLSDNLRQNQDATLAGADAPLINAFAGYYNQGQEANAAAGNATSEFNAEQYGNVVSGNETAYNNYSDQLEQQGSQYGDALLSAYLGSYAPANSSALSTLGQSPGAVGSAYSSGLASGSGTSGATAGAIDSVFNAFTSPTTTPSYNTYQTEDEPVGYSPLNANDDGDGGG